MEMLVGPLFSTARRRLYRVRTTPRDLPSRLAWAWRRCWQPERHRPVWVRTRSGAQLYLSEDPVDDHIAMSIAQRHQEYFPPSFAVGAGALIVDIGAHGGLWTMEALRFWPGTHVLAVEPNPAAVERIHRQLMRNRLFDRCTLFPAALDSQGARMTRLYLASSGSWGNTLCDVGTGRWVEVPTLTLEQMLCGRRPTLVKCNAEGAEYSLVPQLIALEEKPRYLMLALHPEYGDVADAIGALTRAGYHCTATRSEARRPFYHCEWREWA
jgi:FkbM family methyltransferase